MKLKFGAIVVDGRNKVGGHVLSKNRAGSYMRTKVTPVNPRSTFQVNVRARLASLASAWRSLTQAQRDSWNNAVADFKKTDIFGDIKLPSGFNLYCKLNANLEMMGETTLDTAPAPIAVPALTSLAGAAASGAQTITLTVAPTTNPAGFNLVVRATGAISAGKQFVKSEFRLVDPDATNTAGAVSLTSKYLARLGAIGTAGQKIFVEAAFGATDTGQVGQFQRVEIIIT